MEQRRKQARGWHQHFIGSWARLNCENMPVIPAWLVRSNLNDPRRIPYLLVWKDERHDGEIKEAVRLARYVEPSNSRVADNYVELKRADGSTYSSTHHLAHAAPERWAGLVAGLLLLQRAAPSRLRMGVGQLFGMVEQSQAN